jgi:hypothetical protein
MGKVDHQQHGDGNKMSISDEAVESVAAKAFQKKEEGIKGDEYREPSNYAMPYMLQGR